MKKPSFSILFASVVLLCLFAFASVPSRGEAQTPQTPAPPAGQSAVVATVNDQPIFERELTASQPRIAEVRKLIASAGKDQIEVWVKNRLLQQEVQKLGVSYNQLFSKEVADKSKAPTEEEARQYYEKNRKTFTDDYDSYRDYIMGLLDDTHQRERLDQYLAELRAKAKVVANPAPSGAAGSVVLASVNDDKVTAAELDDTINQYVFSLQIDIYNTQFAEIQSKIADKHIDIEAKRRAVPADQLVKQEVEAKARKITDDDVTRFYVENGEQINDSFQNVKAKILDYLKQEALQEARNTFVESLRSKAKVVITLPEPEAPVVHLSDVAEIAIGPANAPVTVVEFTDYQCPTCAQVHAVVDQVLAAYGSKVRLIIRDLPLYIHENAAKAAEAVHAAAAQGKYREYSNLLYQNQNSLSVPFLKVYADQAGLDRERFDAELDSGRYAPIVKRDLEEADRLNVHSTPTFFINKRVLTSGLAFDNLKKAIDRELEKQGTRK